MSRTRSIDTVVDPGRSVRRLVIGAVVIEVALLVLNYVFNFYDIAGDISIRRIFNIAREGSLPTFFASLQAVAVGITAVVLRYTARDAVERRAWTVVAMFWIYVGVDDNVEIHERVGTAIGRKTEGSALTEWWPAFPWQIFVAPVLALGLLASVVIAWRAAGAMRPLLLVCLGCFAVAQGIDYLEGLEGKFDEWAADLDVDPYTIGHGLRSVEEMLEMFGTTAYGWVALTILAGRLPGRRLRFVSSD